MLTPYRLTLMRVYFLLATLLSAWSLFRYFQAPSGLESAALGGYSWSRLVLGLPLFAGLLVFPLLLVTSWRQSGLARLASARQWLTADKKRFHWILASLLALFLLAGIVMLLANKVLEGPYFYYLKRIQPLAGWLFWLSALSSYTLVLFTEDGHILTWRHFTLPLFLLFVAISMHIYLWQIGPLPKLEVFPRGEDIFYLFSDGRTLLEGVNPYARILESDMRQNEKYATLFPIFYYLSAGIQYLGLKFFLPWLDFWRVIFLLFNLAIGLLLYYRAIKIDLPLLAALVTLFWFFNRWTLFTTLSVDIDFMPICLIILSLYLLPRAPVPAYLIFGLSLGIKHIGIFVAPLYLAWAWQAAAERKTRAVLWAVIWIGLIPFLASLPFLVWNAESLFKSILFSTTRDATESFGALSVDALLNLVGIPAKLPMFALFALVYLLAWRANIGRYTAVMFIMIIFVYFNSFLFKGYWVWTAAFIPLCVVEVAELLQKKPISVNK